MTQISLNLIVILSAILGFLVVCILLSGVGKSIDRRESRIKYANQSDGNEDVYDELSESFFVRIILPRISSATAFLSTTFPFLFGSSNKKAVEDTERQLRLAGIRMNANDFIAIKSVAMIGSLVLGFLLSALFWSKGIMVVLCVFAFCLMGSILVPRFIVSSKGTARQKIIQNSLPDVIDLLSVSITAGLSFDASVKKVTEKMEGPFIDELKVMHKELKMGKNKRDALRGLADCADIQELRTFVSAIIQADQTGIPIKNILQAQSVQMRAGRKARAQEKAQKLPVLMLIPMVLFIFPVVFIVILGPTALTALEMF